MSTPAVLERRITSDAPAATRDLAASVATVARPGDLICLWGELGAGKTQFAKGFGAGLGVTDTINSPSFVLMAEYAGRLPLFHIDLFRLDDSADAVASGLLDERQTAGVTLIEWAERLADALPAARLEVEIGGSGDEPRSIRVRATDPRYGRYLDAIDALDGRAAR
jgi:tRNA threonylcarbamoyladenosine biosynthesis protein TsaE